MDILRKNEIVEAVTEAFGSYEAALNANDVDALQNFFHQSSESIRYGLNEQLYGYESIATFRKNRVINFKNRTQKRLEIAALSETVATTMYEYSIEVEGEKRTGRQSQTWLKRNGEWKIITAHVSLLPLPGGSKEWNLFASQASACLGFSISPAHIAGVVTQLETMDRLAKPLMDFDLPESVEPAPVFRP